MPSKTSNPKPSKEWTIKDLGKPSLRAITENLYITEVITLCNLFDLDPSKITIGPPGNTKFKCPYCHRVKTSSLIMFVIHLTGFHYDKMPDKHTLDRDDLKILSDFNAGKRRTLPKRLKRQRPKLPMQGIV